MKLIAIPLALLMLVGCAPYHTLEELEVEAQLTGDWTKVEARERRVQAKQARKELVAACDELKMIVYCEYRGGDKDCGCVRRSEAMKAAGFSNY
jgi:hypothetical protein